MVMQCPYHILERMKMFDEINKLCPALDQEVDCGVLMGKYIEGLELEQMIPIWSMSCTLITQMYHGVLNAG